MLGKILERSSKIDKAFFCKKTGALGTEVHKLGVLALCWGSWAQELGEPLHRMRGNRSPGDGGTGRPADPIRSLFLTVRTPRQAWLGNDYVENKIYEIKKTNGTLTNKKRKLQSWVKFHGHVQGSL